jgi:hypothetical protein
VHIDWGTLVTIGVVATAAAVSVVLLVSFAILGLSASPARPVHDRDGGASGGQSTSGVALAVVCLLAAGLIVSYGLYLIIA